MPDDDKTGVNASSAAGHTQGEIQAVGFKPPPFWKSNAEPYFCFIEAQFATSGISSDLTKYYCLVSALDETILSHASDLICNPPVVGKYDSLKKRLIDHFSESEASKLRMLLHDLELGDKKPSHLLREMKELAKNFSDDAVKALWLQRLPMSVQQILSVSNDGMDSLAEMADKILEVSKSAVVSTVDRKVESVSEVSLLRKEMAELRQQMSRMGRDRSRTRSRDRFRAKSSSSERRNDHELCWYHHRFGKKARNCRKPCKFVSEN